MLGTRRAKHSDVNYGGCAGSGQTDFWKLQLIAGDEVVIDWESATGSVGHLDLLEPGTTDFNVAQSRVLDTLDVGVNNKAESTFTATQTGGLSDRLQRRVRRWLSTWSI